MLLCALLTRTAAVGPAALDPTLRNTHKHLPELLNPETVGSVAESL